MNIKRIIKDYFDELKKEVKLGESSGEATSELSYRTSLDNFFKAVALDIDSKIGVIPEPKNQNKKGRPDWRFHDESSMGVYGYVEAKGLDQKLHIDIPIYKNQVDRYLVLGNPVILTDGVDFILFEKNGNMSTYSVFKKPIDWNSPEFNYDIEILFKEFFKKPGFRVVSEDQLIEEVAKRTSLLSGEIYELIKLDEDEAESSAELKTISKLKEIKETVVKYHDKTLSTDDLFASFLAQVLAFGLLYAHRAINDDENAPPDRYYRLHKFWSSVLDKETSSRLIPFKEMIGLLEEELASDMSTLGVWYDDLRRLLSHIQLTKAQISDPDFDRLFERFLAIYDPETRFDFGAFYTHSELANYLVRLSEQLLSASLDIAKEDIKYEKILDPCCGTGTFIESVISSLASSDVHKVIGFEILPAPYALAHYRIALMEGGYPDNVRIILTNTLSDTIFDESLIDDSTTEILVQEQKEAYSLSGEPVTFIIGNPPSSDSKFDDMNDGSIITELVNDFRPPIEERRSRQNTQKQLTNEFIKFLRWSISKTSETSPSMVSLILPSSFAESPSYKYARKHIIEKFQEVWVLEFDSDIRSGVSDDNLFATLQGRLAIVCISNTSGNSALKHLNISKLSRQEKISFFQDESIKTDLWNNVDLDVSDYSFRYKEVGSNGSYSSFWPLTDEDGSGIFLRHCSGLKLAPTHLLVHASQGQLKRRSKFIADTANSFDDIKARWYKGQLKPPAEAKITDAVRSALAESVKKGNLVDYSYRPFVTASVVIDDSLLSVLKKLGGGGTRDRPEIREAFKDSDTIGFSVSPAPSDIGENLHKFSSFCWSLPDNDLSSRGNGRVFCNFFPEYKGRKKWDSSLKPNINSTLLDVLEGKLGLNAKELLSIVVYYSYAILSSQYYLNLFNSELFSMAGEWPKIPITLDKDLMYAVAEIGRAMAQAEAKEGIDSHYVFDLDGISYHKFQIRDSSIFLKDAEKKVVKKFEDIDSAILNYKVSGHSPIREFLKLHSYPYLCKELTAQDSESFNGLLNSIRKFQELTVSLDELIPALLDSELLGND